jgi:hypothetical protein
MLIFCGASVTINLILFRTLGYEAPDQTRVLIVGDSRAEVGFRPDSIPRSVNVAASAEPLMLTYYKLAWILPRNPQITTVVLSLGYHSFADVQDGVFTRRELGTELFDRVYPIVDWWELRSVVPMDFDLFSRMLLTRYLVPDIEYGRLLMAAGRGKPVDFPPVGGFRVPPARSTRAPSKVASNRFALGGGSPRISEVQRSYLDRIVELSQERDLSLVLVMTPVDPAYLELVPEVIRSKVDNDLESLERAGAARVLDLSGLEMPEGSLRDPDHVSASGASRVSSILAEYLAQGGS